jgi:hypothetical protein
MESVEMVNIIIWRVLLKTLENYLRENTCKIGCLENGFWDRELYRPKKSLLEEDLEERFGDSFMSGEASYSGYSIVG